MVLFVDDIVYSPNKYRETEGIKVQTLKHMPYLRVLQNLGNP